MEMVFEIGIRNAVKEGERNLIWCICRELKGWLTSVLREHFVARRNKMTKTSDQFHLKSNELVAALTIFLIPALAALLVEIVGIAKMPAWAGSILGITFLGSIIVPLIWAIIRGFPRWSPPYLGVLLVVFTYYVPFWGVWGLIYPFVTRWLGSMYTWPLSSRIFIQGIQAAIIWSLVLLSTLILVSILRIFPHTRALWERIRHDWTQLSFFMYGGLVVHIIFIFDEYQKDEPWLIATWLVLAVGSWLYLHSREQFQRILILLCGATLAMWIVTTGKWFLVPHQNWGPWFERFPPETERWFESGRTIADWLCFVVALLIPALLNLLPKKPKTGSNEDIVLA